MEREVKIRLLDGSRVGYLYQALPKPERVIAQVNHYFDTPRRELRKARAMLRLRESTAGNVFTLKHRVHLQGGYLQAEETEEPTDLHAADLGEPGILSREQLPEAIRALLDGGNLAGDLVRLGALRNERRVIRMPQGFTLEFDKTIFPGQRIDYEIEVETETPDHVIRVLSPILDAWEVPFDFQDRTKYDRFLETIGE